MTLLKVNPFLENETIFNHINNLMKDFSEVKTETNEFSPNLDISENKDSLFIDIEIPGIDKKDVKIILKDNTLLIEGEKKNSEERENNNIFRSERNFGKFSRSFKLTDEINQNEIEANFNNGLLSIKLNKAIPVQPEEKVININ